MDHVFAIKTLTKLAGILLEYPNAGNSWNSNSSPLSFSPFLFLHLSTVRRRLYPY